MNCFNLDLEGKGLTLGIPVEGIDGISLGGTQMVMFGQSDLVPNLREMADLGNGKTACLRVNDANSNVTQIQLSFFWLFVYVAGTAGDTIC